MAFYCFSFRLRFFIFLRIDVEGIPPSEDEITYWWEVREAEFYARRDGCFALYSS